MGIFRVSPYIFLLASAHVSSLTISLEKKYQEVIYRHQDFSLNRLRQRHIDSIIPVEKFFYHISERIRIANWHYGHAKHISVRHRRKTALHTLTPFGGTAAMKFIHYDILHLHFRQYAFKENPAIYRKYEIFQRNTVILSLELHLGEDVR